MGRKGISFTLTVVVAGVILLMTALTLIAGGGTAIQNFFDVIFRTGDVAEQCASKADTITNQYCSKYVATSGFTITWTDSGTDGPTSDDSYQVSDASLSRSEQCENTRDSRVTDAASRPDSDSSEAMNMFQNNREDDDTTVTIITGFTQTASDAGCDWQGRARTLTGEISPDVQSGGNTYSCIEEGHFTGRCPVR